MYRLIRSRYDGMSEVEEEIMQGSYQELKEYQLVHCGGGAYVDGAGHEWYTEIVNVEGRKEEMAKKEIMRLNINVPQDLIDRVDEYAENLSINRTSAVCVLLSQALDAQKTVDLFGRMVDELKASKSPTV